MTTSAKPLRTMLPPNLTRNYYEVKRLVAERDGKELPHWYQLTTEQKQAEELDVEMFRRAILRAEEEQDLVANFNAPAAEQPTIAAEPTAAAAEPCDCPGCSTRLALAELIKQAKRLEATLGWDADSRGRGAIVYAFQPPLTAEQLADVEKRAREATSQWVSAGRPLKMTGSIPASRLALDGFGLSRFDRQRWGLSKLHTSTVFLRGLL
jgi:hypothetical protein